MDDQKKLKVNDSKTEFLIFRFPQCKVSLNGVSVSVGDSNILPSPKVRDLGVIFYECLTLNASKIERLQTKNQAARVKKNT